MKRLNQIKKALVLSLIAGGQPTHHKVFLNLLEKNESAKFLDCGCSTGELTREYGKKIGTSDLYGLDIDEDEAQIAEKNGIKVYLGDLNERFPVEDETFDVVCSSATIEHLYNTDGFIKEIRRVLKRGGYAVLSTPNLAAWHCIAFLILGWQPIYTYCSDEMKVGNPIYTDKVVEMPRFIHPAHHHLRVFTAKALKELFQNHGFQVEKIVGSGYLFFYGKIGKLLSSIDPKHSGSIAIKARKRC